MTEPSWYSRRQIDFCKEVKVNSLEVCDCTSENSRSSSASLETSFVIQSVGIKVSTWGKSNQFHQNILLKKWKHETTATVSCQSLPSSSQTGEIGGLSTWVHAVWTWRRKKRFERSLQPANSGKCSSKVDRNPVFVILCSHVRYRCDSSSPLCGCRGTFHWEHFWKPRQSLFQSPAHSVSSEGLPGGDGHNDHVTQQSDSWPLDWSNISKAWLFASTHPFPAAQSHR